MSDAPIDQATGLPEGYHFRPDDEITPRETKSRMESDGSFVVIDCREDDELQTAKLEGPIHIPLGKLVNEVEDVADELPEGRTTPTAILCRTGKRSLMAALALRRMGFTDVKSVAGGIDLWARDIDQTLTRY